MDTAVNEEFIPDVTEGKISLLPISNFICALPTP